MKLLDSKCLDSTIVELKFVDQQDGEYKWEVGELVELFEDMGVYYAKQMDFFSEIEINSPKLQQAISRESTASVLPVICYKHRNVIAVRFIYLVSQYEQSLSLFLDELHISKISKLGNIKETYQAAEQWYFNEFFFDDQERSSSLVEMEISTKSGCQSFVLIGVSFKSRVKKIGKQWVISSIDPFDGQFGSLFKYHGEHTLVDQSAQNGANKSEHLIQLEEHTKEYGSYFELWEQYSETHWRQHLDLAKAAGYLHYKNLKSCSDEQIKYEFMIGDNALETFLNGYKAELEKLGDQFSPSSVELLIAKEIPDWFVKNEQAGRLKIETGKPQLMFNIEFNKGSILATLHSRPPSEGFILLSLNGVKKQYERKKSAFEQLRKGNNPLPQLRSIFEGVNPPEIGKRKNLRAMSSTLRRRLGDKKLNKGQEKALKIALNTPDIALIIGPPGTGKTQVISAIQQRIAEEGDRYGAPIQYQTLLSSYQHDAVDNVVSRSGVFGLPAIKVGGKASVTSNGQASSVKSWITERVQKLRPNLEEELEKSEELKLLDTFLNLCLNAKLSTQPSQIINNLIAAQGVLTSLTNEFALSVSQTDFDDFENILARYARITKLVLDDDIKLKIRRLICGIRTEITSHNDDGNLRLNSLIHLLKQYSELDIYTAELLEIQRSDIDCFERLREIQTELLNQLQDVYIPPTHRCMNKAECNVIDKVISELENAINSEPRLGQLYSRRKYVESLYVNELKVNKAVTDYVSVLGATCQQAAGEQMLGVKSVPHSNDIKFGSVIVDEAARANPLDLMIPMSMAEKRVILVGDHRQLPHMLEPRVEKELQDKNELEILQSELLKQSLFERLYRTLKGFENESRQSNRVAVLDTQYRMHPLLGGFVSREFYEAYGMPVIKPGLPKDNFPLDIVNYENKVAAWINVPSDKGKVESRNGSKYREVEAKAVAKEAAQILNSNPDISVGIITFYAAQSELIQEEAIPYGVMQHTQNGIESAHGYDFLSNGEERFRVGTVDSFQGKEFDVVLLSPVRGWNSCDNITTDVANQKLGFLRIPNRINVAMSRQKRLLIVVGDISLASTELAKPLDNNVEEKGLIGFPAFLEQMCKKEYGLVL